MQTLALLAFIPAAISAQVILEDDFNDSAVNPSLWSVILPNAGSSVVESGGVLTTNGRGVLGSLADFTAPYKISGSFVMNHHYEHFNVVLRTDFSAGDYDERRGILISFSNDGDDISIQRYNNGADWDLVDNKSYALTTGQSYAFEIVDTGSLIKLVVNGQLELSGSSNYSTGSKVGFYSREFGFTSTSVDSFTFATIPEPTAISNIAGLSIFGLSMIRRKSRST